MDQVTQENLQTLLSEIPEIGSYFVSGLNLYYVAGYEFKKDLVLVEDCSTNKNKWMDMNTLARTRKEVIKPK